MTAYENGVLNENASEAEVLTGAQLYAYVVRQNQSRTETAQARMREYADLQNTLRDLTLRCRRRLLAPVAGGLAYFEAELTNTNHILVLLGDGWFAERSAIQAAELAGRRIDYLRNELCVLSTEAKSLAEQEQIFLGEVATGESYKALPAPASSSATAASSSSTASSSTPVSNKADVTIDSLDVFDEQDELTEDELIAIEREVGDRVSDDEYVEKVMLEHMIAKKEKRMHAEMQRRAASQTCIPATLLTSSSATSPLNSKGIVTASNSTTTTSTETVDRVAPHNSDSLSASLCVSSNAPEPTMPDSCLFRTPADIGPALRSDVILTTDAPDDAMAEQHTQTEVTPDKTTPETSCDVVHDKVRNAEPTRAIQSVCGLMSERTDEHASEVRLPGHSGDPALHVTPADGVARKSCMLRDTAKPAKHVTFAQPDTSSSSSPYNTCTANMLDSASLTQHRDAIASRSSTGKVQTGSTFPLPSSSYRIGGIVERSDSDAAGGSVAASSAPPLPRKRASLFKQGTA